jgi:hypothetical protein
MITQPVCDLSRGAKNLKCKAQIIRWQVAVGTGSVKSSDAVVAVYKEGVRKKVYRFAMSQIRRVCCRSLEVASKVSGFPIFMSER